jgi:hypothetical protein
MTVARTLLVDTSVTRWYHVVCRTVRGAQLLAEGPEDRRGWIEDRLQELSRLFAIEVAAFAVLDNVVHVLVRLSSELAEQWSSEEIARRWTKLHPPRSSNRQPLEPIQDWIDQQVADEKGLAVYRQRLTDLAWFMKCLREPIARRANRQDECRGPFWQGRYQTIAILDDEALLASCVSIDLRPMVAGLATRPEDSAFTSLRLRLRLQGASRPSGSAERKSGTTHAVTGAPGSSPDDWLCPLGSSAARDSHRTALLEGLTLDGYVHLVNWTARSVLQDQTRSSSKAESVLKLLEISPDIWKATLKKLLSRSRHLGVAFAFSRQRLKEAAQYQGRHHLANINGCPATPVEARKPS